MNELKINTIYQGSALEVQRTFPEKSIDMCMTSPPYWGLRDYGMPPIIWNGDVDCEHEWEDCGFRRTGVDGDPTTGKSAVGRNYKTSTGAFCQRCGAWNGQLGLEPTPDLYIKHLCDVFDETWRVLKDGGSLWVNIADSYGSGTGQGGHLLGGDKKDENKIWGSKPIKGLQKSLVGIPERFVLEMINRGWTRRNTIIWFKPNCMPTSSKDRFTVDFEYIYFFTKKKRYYFEQQFDKAITFDDSIRDRDNTKLNNTPGRTRMGGLKHNKYKKRNKRCVWRITTKPFPGAHFAVFPEELCEIPIKAACPRHICKKCEKPRTKIYKSDNPSKEFMKPDGLYKASHVQKSSNRQTVASLHRNDGGVYSTAKFMGYTTCGCNVEFKSGICLDPFFGSGTVGVVARRLGRNYVGIELNPEYITIAKERLKEVQTELDVV